MARQSNETDRKICSRSDIPQVVDGIRDRLGYPIDKKIKPLVIGLLSAGVGTFASCEGHAERGFCYPWVDMLVRYHDRVVDLVMVFNLETADNSQWNILGTPLAPDAEVIRLCPADIDQPLDKLQNDALALGEWLLNVPFNFSPIKLPGFSDKGIVI